MPGRKSTRTRRSRRTQSMAMPIIRGIRQADEPESASLTAYKGPVWDRGAPGNTDISLIPMMYTVTAGTNAAGVMALSYNNDPSAYIEWTGTAARFDEYRCLAFQVEYFPYDRYSKTTVLCKPLVAVVDRDSVEVLGSYAAGFAYSSARMMSLEDPWTDDRSWADGQKPLVWKMSGVREAPFRSTQSAAPTSAIKLYGDGLSASTVYGRIIVRGLYQFRGVN